MKYVALFSVIVGASAVPMFRPTHVSHKQSDLVYDRYDGIFSLTRVPRYFNPLLVERTNVVSPNSAKLSDVEELARKYSFESDDESEDDDFKREHSMDDVVLADEANQSGALPIEAHQDLDIEDTDTEDLLESLLDEDYKSENEIEENGDNVAFQSGSVFDRDSFAVGDDALEHILTAPENEVPTIDNDEESGEGLRHSMEGTDFESEDVDATEKEEAAVKYYNDGEQDFVADDGKVKTVEEDKNTLQHLAGFIQGTVQNAINQIESVKNAVDSELLKIQPQVCSIGDTACYHVFHAHQMLMHHIGAINRKASEDLTQLAIDSEQQILELDDPVGDEAQVIVQNLVASVGEQVEASSQEIILSADTQIEA